MLQGESAARLVQGAIAGVVLATLNGFGWGDWMLGSTAQRMADSRATRAVVAALVPICVEKFQRGNDAQAQLLALRKVESWRQDEFIVRGGWATFPGNENLNRRVAEACAHILSGAS